MSKSASVGLEIRSRRVATSARVTRMGEKDIIGKQVVSHLAADMANYLLGLDIESASLQ